MSYLNTKFLYKLLLLFHILVAALVKLVVGKVVYYKGL